MNIRDTEHEFTSKINIDDMRCTSMEDYINEMQGIYSTSVSEYTLDESPMAYKSMDNIIAHIEQTAKILHIIKPIYNFKAAEDLPSWKKK